jgi:hypothetical protein
MPYRLFPIVVLVLTGLVGLMGAFGLPISPPQPTLALPPNITDPAAEQTLNRTIVALAPERLGCVETQLWQKVTLPNLTYEANGRYLLGPQRRIRLELHTKQGTGVTTRLAVCDGATLWEGQRVGGGEWERVTKLDLATVLATLEGEGRRAQLRAQFFQEPRFEGVVPLLRDLLGRMNWVKEEKMERDGQPRLRLAGVWKADFAAAIRSAPTWPAGLPEQCRLELDALTLWPYRLEWWGPATAGAADTLLAQVEFRNPVVYPTLSPERCAKEFAFEPGKTHVEDQTAAVKKAYEEWLK